MIMLLIVVGVVEGCRTISTKRIRRGIRLHFGQLKVPKGADAAERGRGVEKAEEMGDCVTSKGVSIVY